MQHGLTAGLEWFEEVRWWALNRFRPCLFCRYNVVVGGLEVWIVPTKDFSHHPCIHIDRLRRDGSSSRWGYPELTCIKLTLQVPAIPASTLCMQTEQTVQRRGRSTSLFTCDVTGIKDCAAVGYTILLRVLSCQCLIENVHLNLSS